MLHAESGMKHREIASLLDMPISTVLSKYNRGIKRLQTELERML
jgi:RNA polymerase sigma-70 factor (ECF subfamily)